MGYKFKKIDVDNAMAVRVVTSEVKEIKNMGLLNEILDKNKIDVIKEYNEELEDKEYFFNKMSFIVLMLVICPPIGLPFMYAYGKNKKIWKIIITAIVLIIDTILLGVLVYYLKKNC